VPEGGFPFGGIWLDVPVGTKKQHKTKKNSLSYRKLRRWVLPAVLGAALSTLAVIPTLAAETQTNTNVAVVTTTEQTYDKLFFLVLCCFFIVVLFMINISQIIYIHFENTTKSNCVKFRMIEV